MRRIETGERRVDFDDLLVLAQALDVSSASLMVPVTHTDTVPFPIGGSEIGSERVRDWICGDHEALKPPEPPSSSGLGRLVNVEGTTVYLEELPELLSWLPEDRRRQVIRKWAMELDEQAEIDRRNEEADEAAYRAYRQRMHEEETGR